METTTRPTALVVDDDPDLRFQVRLALEGLGFQVADAAGQEEATALLADLAPDIAILDLMMEHEDSGFILAWQVKQRHPACPVVLVTAVSARTGMDFQAASREERSWIRADAVLTKPIRFEQLEKEIRRLVPGCLP